MSDADAREALDWLMRVHDSRPSQQRLAVVRDRLDVAEAAIERVNALADEWVRRAREIVEDWGCIEQYAAYLSRCEEIRDALGGSR